MSYYRPPPESQNSAGGGGREWEYYRDRPSGRNAHGHSDLGVVRDRRRAMSNDRNEHDFPRPPSSDMRSRSRHDRRPYDVRHRGGSASGEAERGREWARRDRDHLGLPRRNSNREPLYREGNAPPPLFPRHTASAFVRGRGNPPHMAAAVAAAAATSASATPHFSRRATEPGESLEEGELEMDSRSGPPHRRGIGSRMHTSPAGAGAHLRRNEPFPPALRTDRRSPLPASPVHPSAFHSRPASRKPSHSSFKPEVQHSSRKPTPSSMHLPQRPVEIVRTPSPVSLPRSPATGSVASEGRAFKAESREATAPRDGSRTPSPRSTTPEPDVPKQQLQSRISDIDREIAECKEKLDQISGSRQLEDKGETSLQTQAQSPLPKKQQKPAASNDRAVPTSPPVKSTLPLSASSDAVSVVRSEATAVEALPIATADVKAAVAAEIAAPVVPQATGGHSSEEAADMDVDLLLSDSASEGEEPGKGKDKLLGLVNSIYAENQKKAAEIQARLAAPFLEAYSKLIPGQYPSPTDWPFWAESEKKHERLRPHLVRILGQEKRQEQTHARQLQTEYSTLYAKWRKRVDRLDRQREAKQRSNSMSAGSSNQSTFGATTHRRRGGVVPSNTTDEFGFSLGPLFSASVSASHHIDAGGRLDDSLFTSDAVHSEAELQAIIERLQHDDARNPDLRSQRTAATIPDMVLDPKERAMLRFDNNSHKIADPISFYHVRMPPPGSSDYRRVAYGNNADSNHYWTQNEVSAFIAAYLTYPKEFGKIAAHIPHKSMNECVLFYYRNKKQLKLKELEAKSVKRARRSRQAASGSSGRRRKERARERRERRAREERERMAMEVAAECAPNELDAGIDDTSAQAQTSAMASDDDGAASATGANSTGDVLEQRSKGSALLRSIIAANRQRKREAVMDGSSLLSLDDNVTGTDKLPALVSPSIEAAPLPADDDEDLEEDADGTTSPAKSLPVFSRSDTLQPSDRRRQQSDGPSGALSLLPGVPLSSASTRVRREEAPGSSSNRPASDEEEDDEEEGELVEDTRWEPRRRSRQTSELNAYAMGGSIVRTRRTRELEQASGAYASDSESDSAQVGRRNRRRSSLVSAYGEDEEEIVEISGVVADRGQAASQERNRPRIVSRRSQSRFGAMLTAVLEPEDATNADAGDDAEGGLMLARQRSITPQSAAEWSARAQAGSPPQESALDRFVAAEPEALQRPISSHETLMMCLSATNSLTSPVTGLPGQQSLQPTSGPTQSVHQQQLEAQVNAEAGTQDTVLVGAAAWVRDDRRRVLRGFHKLGADFAQVASLMPSKTTAQCRYFYYHYRTPAGTLISEIIGNGMQASLPAAPASAKASSDSRQPNVDSLVLPPVSRSQSSAAGFSLPMQDKPQTGDQSKPGTKLQPVESSSSEDDDEMPLATQLAEELAALERSHPTTPVLPGGVSRRGSEIPQVRPEQLNPRVTPIASLVLPPKTASDQPLSAGGPLSSTSSAMNNVSGRTSPHSPVPGATTAKKSGYSSYWSVHERSAFMHYVVRLGQNWQRLAEAIGSKTGTQVRNYFRANREKLGLDAVIAEYERNRAAGTLPPMVPFQPPVPSASTASSANAAGGTAAKDDGGVRKEKRGRKRKTDLAAAAAAVAAKSPRAETIEHDGVPLAQGAGASSAIISGSVPANMANFPTMGIDGGRAVVYTRPPPPPATAVQQRAQQSHGQQMWAQQPQSSARHSLPPPYAGQAQQRPPSASYQYPLPQMPGNAEIADQQQRIGSVARDDSNTPLSQPTPPPVEGLPRFSSSPAPPAVAVSQQQPAVHRGSLSALHISNLTESSGSNSRVSGNRQQRQQQAASSLETEEPRKVSVTKINALLNDEPTETKPEDWFENEPQQQQPSQEDDATGIAALALASMMGSRASPHAEPPQQQRHRLAYPQPRASIMHRPSDPLPPIAASQPMRGPSSAFSPVSPSGQLRSLSRPSSVDPTNAYSRGIRVLSPAPVAAGSSSHHPQQRQQNMRQRKPSAPPLPPPSVAPFTSRSASVYAGYPPPPAQARHAQYPHDPSSQPVYSEPPHRYEQPPRTYPPNQQLQPPAGHYYPMSPRQQQQQQQQQQQSTGTNNPPMYSPYRQQPPYHHHPPM